MSPAPPSLESADPLYRGFPDFSTWGPLQPEDEELWSRFAESLEERRKAVTPEALKASVDVAIRAAALDTGAIEGLYTVDRGFTMTVAIQGLAWEQMIGERGAGVRELFEAQLTAYEMVLDAVTHKLPVTEAWIRALHETLCAPQKTHPVLTASGWQEHEFPKGQYKNQPNHVRLKDGTVHAYAPVDQVSAEMHRLVDQLRSPAFETAHPMLQASWVHYAFVAIHPFADGNGRVARALASVYFYRFCSIPLLIFANQRLAYFDALHAADLGELRSLILFFRDRGIDTMQLVIDNLLTSEAPDPALAAARLRKLVRPLAGLSLHDLDNLALRLLAEVESRLKSSFERLNLPEEITLKIATTETNSEAPPGYRRISLVKPGTISYVQIESHAPPAKAKVTEFVRVVIAEDETRLFSFLLETPGSKDAMEIRLSEVLPEHTPALSLRLDGWIRRLLGRLLKNLEMLGRASLKKSS